MSRNQALLQKKSINARFLLLTMLLLPAIGYAAAVQTELNVSACSMPCAANELNTNDTTDGLTIGKGANSVLVITDPLIPDGNITSVRFRLRHSGGVGISGSWTIDFLNDTLVAYCTDNTIAHTSLDGYADLDITSTCPKLLSVDNLSSLKIRLTNGDGGRAQNAVVRFVDIYVEYQTTSLEAALLSADTSVMQNRTFRVAASVTCRLEDCGTVTGTPRYNATGSEPDMDIKERTGQVPFTNATGAVNQHCDSMSAGQQCQLTWLINATGRIGQSFNVDVNFISAAEAKNTANAQVDIVAVSPVLAVALDRAPALVMQNRTFNVSASIRCLNGRCVSVTGAVRYNASGSEPNTNVNATAGEVPFYAQSVNQSCGRLNENQHCALTWLVNATGAIASTWSMDVNFTSTDPNIESNDTQNAQLAITRPLLFASPFKSTQTGRKVNIPGWPRCTQCDIGSASRNFDATDSSVDIVSDSEKGNTLQIDLTGEDGLYTKFPLKSAAAHELRFSYKANMAPNLGSEGAYISLSYGPSGGICEFGIVINNEGAKLARTPAGEVASWSFATTQSGAWTNVVLDFEPCQEAHATATFISYVTSIADNWGTITLDDISIY